ncbi:MAG: hypothetical protein IJY01_00410 [Clostridia bacterium]|nr:hypothetical protein [Clostridia bacterium]
MILFYDASGNLIYNSIPDSLNQGSSRANEITIVGPFAPSSVLTIDFWLPDGKVLGHSFVDDTSTEYKLTAAFAEGGGYPAPDGTVLYAWSYSVNSALTAVGGTLAFAVTVHTSDGDALALDTVSININNGVPNIPINPTIPQDAEGFYNEVLEYITGASNAMAAAQEAQRLAEEAQAAAEEAAAEVDGTLSDSVKKNTDGSPSLEQTINSSIKIIENLTVDGDFNVKGKTTIVDHETLTVNDNIIVTNAGDEPPIDSLSGLVINTGELASDGISFKGYGIVFVPPLATDDNPNPDPSDGTVKLGLGTITRTADGLAEFAFDEGEAQTVATRDEFEDTASNIIPMWDAVKRSFVPSGKTTSDFVPKDVNASAFLPRYVFGIDYLGEIKRIPVGNFGNAFNNGTYTPIVVYLASSDTTPGNPPANTNQPLHLWTSDPTQAYHAVSLHYADETYVSRNTTTVGSYLYAHVGGEERTAPYGSVANGGYVVQRGSTGNITLPDQITTPPTSVDHAISQRYGDGNYVKKTTNQGSIVYTSYQGVNGIQYYSTTPTSYHIVQRDVNGWIRLPTASPIDDFFAVPKKYVDDMFVSNGVYEHVMRFKNADESERIEVTIYNTSDVPVDYDNFALINDKLAGKLVTFVKVESEGIRRKPVYISSISLALDEYPDGYTIVYNIPDTLSFGKLYVSQYTDSITPISSYNLM